MTSSEASADAAITELVAARSWLQEARPDQVSDFLRGLADVVTDNALELLDIAVQETGLAWEKLAGEVVRTTTQLKMFADVGEAGALWEVVVDHADSEAVPPRPELRKVMRPLGIVGVFAASNFPFAFGITGGDVASALVARCPVLVRAHPAHPRLSERLAQLIRAFHEAQGCPIVLGVVSGDELALGRAIVEHNEIRAIGFTGSQRGGLALAAIAATRSVPIPVYAEMGSVNPLLITPGGLGAGGSALVERLVGSLLIGHGQMCTKPGLIAVPESSEGDRFVEEMRGQLAAAEPQRMLHASMQEAVARRIAEDQLDPFIDLLLNGVSSSWDGLAFSLASASLATVLRRPDMLTEVFGPYALVVRYERTEDLLSLLASCGGTLTVSLQIDPIEGADSWLWDLADLAAEKAGRVVWNGMPTGVAPVNAMHHGGPFPATTDGMYTAVGADAVRRFLRPVTYQDAPADLLPPPAREANPWQVPQRVDHRWVGSALRKEE